MVESIHQDIFKQCQTYPQGISARRRPVPGVVVGHGAHGAPRHSRHHVGAVHRVEVLAERGGRIRREGLAALAGVARPPAHGQPAGGGRLEDQLQLGPLRPPEELMLSQLDPAELGPVKLSLTIRRMNC